MPTRVVCISQTTGSGGEAIGQAVAERLGFRHVDEEIVVRAAREGNFEPRLVAEIEKRQTFMARFLQAFDRGAALDSMNFSGLYPPEIPPDEVIDELVTVADSENYRRLIREAIRETAAEGNVVMVSHAASMALGPREGVLRVLVTASAETRAQRLAVLGELDARQATKMVRDTDNGRADYFKRFYKIAAENETHYDLVVNTDVVAPERAIDIIVHAAS
jgi:cytidylate kinase